MELFENILLMLGAIFASNVIVRFLPSISVPLIQVGLGMILVLFIPSFEVEINSDLFLILFMAPLLFHDGKNADKNSLWRFRKPILLLAIGLVFLTVFLLGAFIHYLLPVIPIAAAFALAAALAPTDAVAVSAFAEKVQIPSKTMHILEGESLINDASGLVSFQFAVLALTTGSFSLLNAGVSFILLSVGGVLLGTLISALFILIMRLLRMLGVENIISFMLVDILTPFIIFLIAEKVGVNGVLAAVSGGIVHSFGFAKMNPESAKLNTISRHTWSVILFSLNGLVFILLGSQLPHIITNVFARESITPVSLVLYPVLATVSLLSLRFIWVYLFRGFKEKTSKETLKLKDLFLYTISGVRGTITLVSALSLPFTLAEGQPFVARDLVLFIAAGVIIFTLVLANFCLPLLAEKKVDQKTNQEMEIAILRDVVANLKGNADNFNSHALNIVIYTYNERIRTLKHPGRKNEAEQKIRIQVYNWALEDTKNQLRSGKISSQIASSAFRRLHRRLYLLTKDKRYRNRKWHRFMHSSLERINFKKRQQERAFLFASNSAYIVKNLEKLERNDDNKEIIEYFLMRYQKRSPEEMTKSELKTEAESVAEYALQVERDLIQNYFEKGKITRPELRKYRENLLVIEADLLN